MQEKKVIVVIDKAQSLIEFFPLSGFYTRKVKYTQETFGEKFQHILDGFPRLQDIHPFRKFSSCGDHGVRAGSNIHQTRI
jgi:GTP1/Obg family GTP-binding protein